MVDRASTIVVEGRGEAVASDGRPFSAIVVGTAAVGFAAFVASLAAAFGVLLASVAESALSLSLVLWEASAR
jgi:hypothetical protein